ncbi:esterase/lipase family protein [Tomitella biformata]|uniref:esterase/lipase family protein n=1 Tax=Tomitella biformata TaxID=630403 RepID=UPI000465B5F3|nr:alpha/beta fold hydrolase [Tomitella biformata]
MTWAKKASAVVAAVLLPLGLSVSVSAPASANVISRIITGTDTDALAGANDWSCRTTAEHPRPVVLVHGTWANKSVWSTLAPQLADEGYCVFALDYGHGPLVNPATLLDAAGMADIRDSAVELAGFVEQVRSATGAAQVDIVGHSQGGVVARQYLRFNGGANPADPAQNAVHSLVTLGATNHGSTFGDVLALSEFGQRIGLPAYAALNRAMGPAYAEQMAGSTFLQELNAGGDTVPGVQYTVVASRDDKVSTPPEATFLAPGDGATVHNVWIQDGCDTAQVSHDGLTSAPRAIHLVQSALSSTYPISHAAPCS